MLGSSVSYLLGSQTMVYDGAPYTRCTQEQGSASNWEYMANLGDLPPVRPGREPQPHGLVPNHPLRRAGLFPRRVAQGQIYIANLGMLCFALGGVVPNLYVKHTDNHSSIDWAYSYR